MLHRMKYKLESISGDGVFHVFPWETVNEFLGVTSDMIKLLPKLKNFRKKLKLIFALPRQTHLLLITLLFICGVTHQSLRRDCIGIEFGPSSTSEHPTSSFDPINVRFQIDIFFSLHIIEPLWPGCL